MASVRETALKALFETLKTVDGPAVKRNENDPERIPSGGLVILEDGEPGEPDVTLSPVTYHYQHQAEITVLVQAALSEDRDRMLDEIAQKIGAVLQPDPTLGGAVEHLEIQAPVTEGLPVEGAEAVKGAIIPVILFYSTESPV